MTSSIDDLAGGRLGAAYLTQRKPGCRAREVSWLCSVAVDVARPRALVLMWYALFRRVGEKGATTDAEAFSVDDLVVLFSL